ncbi:hypothetical protein [Leptospira biflexa]|uniref:hypothetical protein n=1 Tax=Leptospira biflexa TaxID=172 RepID=UPI00108423DC|nr:hypothetical protein [Leptospira biflexa]TGM35199.1 hypothetical protein EHQ89_12065 [Leptospira biflexa]TGM38366.1 hypothetical protein EHQ80_12545 [Leptospira biflexa]
MNIQFEQTKFRESISIGYHLWKEFRTKDWFYLSLYTLIYFTHCFFFWDQMPVMNTNLESELMARNGVVYFWQLYPFQIIPVYVVSFLFVLVSAGVLIVFLKIKNIRMKFILLPLIRKQFQLFFYILSLLYIGNLSLGFFHDSEVYIILILCFWFGLYIYFVKGNVNLFHQMIRMDSNHPSSLSKGIGYLIPILWSICIICLVRI